MESHNVITKFSFARQFAQVVRGLHGCFAHAFGLWPARGPWPGRQQW